MKSSRLQDKFLNHFAFLFSVFILLNTAIAFAGPSRTTYQAKIIKPDGYPLQASNVNFKFTILDPSGSCIIFAESYSGVNMTNTGGLISFSLGSGVKTYPVSSTTFEQIFSNITPNIACDTGGAPAVYTPLANDARKIVMQFHDGGGWQTLPAMNINAVPYAMYANDSQKFNGLVPSDFVQVSTVPTCTASEALRYTGSSFLCVAAGGSGAVSSGSVITALGYTPADGASVTAITTYATNVSSTVYSVSTTVSNLTASMAALTSSQWTTSGTTISYNTGRVGIGTANPGYNLHVVQPVSGSSNITLDSYAGTPGIYFRKANGTEAAPLAVSSASPLLEIAAVGYGQTGYIPTSAAKILMVTEEDWTNTTAAASIRFHTRPSSSTAASLERMRIDKNGNVAIGTTTPITKLDVSGGVRISMEPATCAVSYAGTLRYNSGFVEYCDGTTWTAFGTGGAITSASIAAALSYTPANSATVATSFTTITNTMNTVGTSVTTLTSTVNNLSSSYTSLAAAVSGIPVGWGLTGNSGTSATTNFIGTTDNTDIIFKRNNVRAGLIGNDTTSFGNGALQSNTTGQHNTALGYQAGYNAGVSLQTNQNSTFLGDSANTSVNGLSNVIAIGYQAQATQNNQAVIGNGSIIQNRFSGLIETIVTDASSGVNVINTGSTTSRYPLIQTINYASGTTGHPVLGMHNSQGTLTSPAALLSGMSVGTLLWTGQTSASQTQQIGRIDVITEANIAPNAAPGRMAFSLAGPTGAYAQRLVINSLGYIGVGAFTPTAFLHLPAGTSAAAALKLTSGTLLTTPQSGTIEYDGFNFYTTNGSGTRSVISTGSSGVATSFTATAGRANLLDSTATFGSGHNTVLTGSDSNGLVWHIGVSGTQALDINSRYSGGPITMTIGGSEKMRVMGSSGFVGIGTQTPTQKLDVSGYIRSASGTGGTWSDGGRMYLATNSSGPTYDLSYVGGYTDFSGNDGSGAGSRGGIIFATKETTGAASPIERMRIDLSGNVGLGVSAPLTPMHVQKNAPNGLIAYFQGVGSGGTIVGTNPNFPTSGGLVQGLDKDGGVGTLTINPLGGQVALGTTIPQAKFNIDGVTSPGASETLQAYTYSSSLLWGLRLSQRNNSGIISYNWKTRYASSTDILAMTMAASGLIGIGTNEPLKGLHVVSGSMVGTTEGFPAAYATVDNEFNAGVLKKWTETSGNQVNLGTYSLVAPASSSTKSSHSVVNILFTDVAAGVSATGAHNSFYNFTSRNRYAGNTDNGYVGAMVGIRNEYGHQAGVPGNTPTTGSIYGAVFSPQVMTGTVANLYDIYLGSPTGGGSFTQHYSIYQEAVDATNFFAGRVGIGTTSPNGSLHIVTSALQSNGPTSGIFLGKSLGDDYQIQLTQTGGIPHIDFSRASGRDYDARISSPVNSMLSMGTASNSSLLNLYNNYVGIGLNTPTRALQVGTTGSWQDGSGILIKGANPGLELTDTQATPQRWLMANGVGVANDGNLGLAYNVNTGIHNLVVTSGGAVGVGTISPDDKFVVNNGTTVGRYTTSGWTHVSDKRFKHDIKSLDNSLAKILQLRGVEYKFNADPQNKNQVGFIAQEVEPLFPEVVVTDKKGFKSMVYSNLVAPLVEAVKSLYVQLKENSLETKQNSRAIASLQQENEKLKSENLQKTKELDDVKARLQRIETLLKSK